MRALSTQAQALLASGSPLALTALVEMQLSQTLYLSSWDSDIEWAGQTWQATGILGAIEAVEDSASELRGLKFSLSGVPADSIGLALGENVQGKPCILRLGLMEPDKHVIVDVQTVWSGTLDQMALTEGDGGSAIAVTAEHRGVSMQRPKTLRYTDADQQRLYPGDRFLQYVTAQAGQPVVWPASSYFKK